MLTVRKQAYAVICLDFPTENFAKVIFEALKPETKTSPTPRAKMELRRKTKNLIFSFEARDVVALRASVNSILRFTNSLMQILELVEEIH
jgi:KEOPS complex subunit Pcc1